MKIQEDFLNDGPSPKNEFYSGKKSLNFNFRRTSTADKKESASNIMNRRLAQAIKTQPPTRLGSVQEMANHISSKILLQQNKPMIGTPFSNKLPTAPSQNYEASEIATTFGDNMRTFSSPTEDDFSARFESNRLMTPRGSIMQRTNGFRSTNHLERFKLTTIKSKLKAFRENDNDIKQQQADKLASILKRSVPKTSQ